MTLTVIDCAKKRRDSSKQNRCYTFFREIACGLRRSPERIQLRIQQSMTLRKSFLFNDHLSDCCVKFKSQLPVRCIAVLLHHDFIILKFNFFFGCHHCAKPETSEEEKKKPGFLCACFLRIIETYFSQRKNKEIKTFLTLTPLHCGVKI